MKALFLFSALLLIFLVYMVTHEERISAGQKQQQRYSIFHRPTGGCPPGTIEHTAMFTEKDGTHEAGCHDPAVSGISIDVLKPGESVALSFLIEDTPSPVKPGTT